MFFFSKLQNNLNKPKTQQNFELLENLKFKLKIEKLGN